VVPPGGFGIGQAIPEYYTTPQAGWYATVLLLLAFSSEETGSYQYTPLPPNGNVDIRLTTACNTTSIIGAFVPGAPNYSLAISWTGKLPALTNVGVCVDGLCNFSGFLVH